MKVLFFDVTPNVPVKLFERDITVVPSRGDMVSRHLDGYSVKYEVKAVAHVYEDRTPFQGKDYGGDTICVMLSSAKKI